MNETEVLHQVVFASERSWRRLTTLAGATVVALEVLRRRIKRTAISTVHPTCKGQHDGASLQVPQSVVRLR